METLSSPIEDTSPKPDSSSSKLLVSTHSGEKISLKQSEELAKKYSRNFKRDFLLKHARLLIHFLNNFLGKELFFSEQMLGDALRRTDNQTINEFYSWVRDPDESSHRGVTLSYNLFDKYRLLD